MKEFFTLTDTSKGFIHILLIILALWLIMVAFKKITGKNIFPVQDANGDVSLSNLTIHEKINPS